MIGGIASSAYAYGPGYGYYGGPVYGYYGGPATPQRTAMRPPTMVPDTTALGTIGAGDRVTAVNLSTIFRHDRAAQVVAVECENVVGIMLHLAIV